MVVLAHFQSLIAVLKAFFMYFWKPTRMHHEGLRDQIHSLRTKGTADRGVYLHTVLKQAATSCNSVGL